MLFILIIQNDFNIHKITIIIRIFIQENHLLILQIEIVWKILKFLKINHKQNSIPYFRKIRQRLNFLFN